MDWKALWTKFRGTVYFRLLYLLLVSVLGALSLATTVACVALIIIPVLTLAVPHWFGERRMKHHALNGLLVLVFTTVLFAAMFSPIYASQGELVYAREGTRLSLADGIVRPFHANEGPRDFNFTVTMFSNDTDARNFTVRVHVFSFKDYAVTQDTFVMNHVSNQSELSNGNYADGEQFYAIVPLQPYIHTHGFDAQNRTTNATVLQANFVPGPFHAASTTYFAFFLLSGFYNMILIVVGFYLILLLYWWTRKAREIRGAQFDRGRKRDEGGGEFTCTNCGGDVSEADTKCPNCGAEFGPGPEPSETAKPRE